MLLPIFPWSDVTLRVDEVILADEVIDAADSRLTILPLTELLIVREPGLEQVEQVLVRLIELAEIVPLDARV